MNEQLEKKIKKKVEPINKWIDEVAEKHGPKAAKRLAVLITCEVGKRLTDLSKKIELMDVENLN